LDFSFKRALAFEEGATQNYNRQPKC